MVLEDISKKVLTFVLENSKPILLGTGGIVAVWLMFRRPADIPPGPGFALPVFGHALSLGADPKKKLREWRSKYGDIFSMYLGNRLVIVMNGYDVLVDAFVKNADLFSDRPHVFVIDKISRGRGVAGTSGQVWKEQRRFTLSTLRDFGMGKRVIENAIHRECEYFLKIIEDRKGEAFNIRNIVNTAVMNIIAAILFGRRFDYEDQFLKDLLARFDQNLQVAGTTAGLNFIPIARYIPGDPFKFKRTMKNLAFFEDGLSKPSIEEHVNNFDEDNINDFVAAYVKEIKHKERTGEKSSIGFDNLNAVVGDLVVAGSETTTTTIRWAILLLMKYPEVQKKCFQEIEKNVGLERPPQMSDKLNLPYVEATITEIQRIANIVPLSLWHSVPRDIKFRNFTFSKGVIILPNLESVLHDPNIFENPDRFLPERFLDVTGKFTKVPEMIPFFIGKRACPGESLAKMELFLFIASLIQRFEFQHPAGEPPLTMEAVPGVTFGPKPFKVRAVSRRC